jgi:hypothetical protein
VRDLKIVVFIILAGLVLWGCVEELDTGRNYKPRVWFTRGPDEGEVLYSNRADFQWQASDFDDDLGMGGTYVRLEPSFVPWFNKDTEETVYFEHPEGWLRVYENIYQILDLPDTTFAFSVRVEDARGADSVAVRNFVVRFDNMPPIIEGASCPPAKPSDPNFTWTYIISARDTARTPRAATPQDSLEYKYRFVGPLGVDPVDSDPEWSPENKTFIVSVDGQTFPGEYRFRYQVRDKARNPTEERVCKFNVGQ